MFSNTSMKLGCHFCEVFNNFKMFFALFFRYLDHNQFSGRIPDPFYKHLFLKEMWVSHKVVQITNYLVLRTENFSMLMAGIWKEMHSGLVSTPLVFIKCLKFLIQTSLL